MRRRTLIAAAGATGAALAGCTGEGRLSDGTPTGTTEPCERDREPPNDPGGELDPRELPERPDEWTEESVERFVREYEAAYRQRRVLTEDTTSFGHSETVEVLREVDRGYRVEMRTNFYYNEATDDGEVHADSPDYGVVYLVADDRLRRAAEGGYDADPSLENARTMECW
jgi:hypothetical protein